MDIRPIRTDDDHASALAEIERLWGAAPDTVEGDKLDVLATLVEAYEERRWPVTSPDPVDMIEFAIAEMGHSQAELGRLIGKSRASEILRRKRALTLQMVHTLHEAWHIPAELLIRPYNLKAVAEVDDEAGRNTSRTGPATARRNSLWNRKRLESAQRFTVIRKPA